jgi:hypothetical protein
VKSVGTYFLVPGFWTTTRPALGAFGHHHNRQKIIRIRENIWKRRGARLSQNWRRDDEVASQFLGLRVGFMVVYTGRRRRDVRSLRYPYEREKKERQHEEGEALLIYSDIYTHNSYAYSHFSHAT